MNFVELEVFSETSVRCARRIGNIFYDKLHIKFVLAPGDQVRNSHSSYKEYLYDANKPHFATLPCAENYNTSIKSGV